MISISAKHLLGLSTALMILAATSCSHPRKGADPMASNLRERLDEASAKAREGNADGATAIYQQIATVLPDTTSDEAVRPIIVEALGGIADNFGRTSNPQAVLNWLSELESYPTRLIRSQCMRDLYATLASVMYAADSVSQARAYMQRALATPMYGTPADSRYFRDYTTASRINVDLDSMRPKVMEWLALALRHADKCEKYPPATSYVRSLLGTLYNMNGRIDEAFNLLNANLLQAEEEGDTVSRIYALDALSNLYAYWKLYPEANRYSDVAVALVEGKPGISPQLAGDTYMLKGGAVMHTAPDSVPYYLAKAEALMASRPYNGGMEDVDFVMGMWAMNHGNDPAEARKRLHRYAENAVPVKRHSGCFALARMYFNEGNRAMGVAMLDSLFHYSHLVDSIPTASREAMEYSLSRYIELGDRDKALRCAEDLAKTSFYSRDDEINKQFVSSIIDFRTRNALNELDKLELEMQLRQSRWAILLAVCAVMILLLILIVVLVRHRNRRIRLQQKVLEAELTQAREQSEMHLQGLNTVMDDLENRRAIEGFTVSMLRENGEAEFRKRFNLLHPSFVHRLQATGANIGQREELMCMLFVMGLDIPETAETLHIARSSVNVARHRLKKKFGLGQNESLDQYLASLI